MKQKANAVAQKLLNLYRQQHVIFGGWAAVNQIFITDGTPDVLTELQNIPTGRTLVRHIENIKSGKTPADSIDSELLPYGGLMTVSVATINLTDAEMGELESGLNSFTPDADGLDTIQSLDVIKKFGDEWQVAIRSILITRPDLLDKWAIVTKTARAYYLWKVASDILTTPLSDRARAQIQADLPEYETYLPMFGDTGLELLSKLRVFVSTI